MLLLNTATAILEALTQGNDMSARYSRRSCMKSVVAGGAALGFGDLRAFLSLSPATAAEADVAPELIRFTPDIEPTVRLIEETPREKAIEVIIDQLRRGLPYRQFLAALFLAGIRLMDRVGPGMRHSVLITHAAHQLSLDARTEERLLPLFWALNDFHGEFSNSKHRRDGNVRFLSNPVAGPLPAGNKAEQEFRNAMDKWDVEGADRALVGLIRSRGPRQVMETLWPYGVRDWRRIGHKAISISSTWRCLQTIGWQHAEPALRYAVWDLLVEGKDINVGGYRFDDQCYPPNRGRVSGAVGSLPEDWAGTRTDHGCTLELVALMRDGQTDDACRLTLTHLSERKTQAAGVWDAVHLVTGEFMMRRPNFVFLHSVTTANALHYAFRESVQTETRLLILLQAVGWMCQYRNDSSNKQRPMKDAKITEIEPIDIPTQPEAAVEEILAAVSVNNGLAAQKAYRFAQTYPEPDVFMQAARRLIFMKSTEAHDYKYPAAIFEDYSLVDAKWRPHMLGATVYYLRGSSLPDSPVMQQARDAIRNL